MHSWSSLDVSESTVDTLEVRYLPLILWLSLIALAIAILRLFLREGLDPLGVPAIVGSLLSSLWILLAVALIYLFGRAGKHRKERYWKVVPWFALLALWCELLVIGGILAGEALEISSYFDGPFAAVKENFPTPSEHALGHIQGFFPRLVIWLLLGALVFAVARRRARE